MKTEMDAWDQLSQHAASRLRPGFADRVIRATRAGAEVAPAFFRQFAVCAAAAALCFVAFSFFNQSTSREENDQNLAGWQEIATQTDDVEVTV